MQLLGGLYTVYSRTPPLQHTANKISVYIHLYQLENQKTLTELLESLKLFYI
jgi:hypothetical protein